MEIFFAKTRDTKSPVRGDSAAAGIDIFVPKFDDNFISEYKKLNPKYPNTLDESGFLMIKPLERVLIPTGLFTKFYPKASALFVANKSGVATKKGVHFLAHVIDSNYAGELRVGIVNDSDEAVKIEQGDKLVQLIHGPIYLDNVVERSYDDVMQMHEGSERGDGGFGHYGN